MMLAQKYQVKRLELLCLQVLEARMSAQNVVQVLEAAKDVGDERLLQQCRHFVLDNARAVKLGGGVEEVSNLSIAKGLLSDCLDRIGDMQDQIQAEGEP